MKLKVKRLNDKAVLPAYSKQGDAAVDLVSCECAVLKPMEKKVISTGISMAIPEGHAGFVWDRSGIAAKESVHTMAGVVDSGYRGEIKVVMINLGKEDFRIEEGMRIAQMAIQPVASPIIEESDSLDDTDRAHNGFGSTGK
ncbi:MAG: dUTP diphosphatase [Candidatus Woesearchaeota archaeon]